MHMHAHDLVSHRPHPKPKACVCVCAHKDQYGDTDTVPASWHQSRSAINPVILYCSPTLLDELSRNVACYSMLFIRQLKRNCVSPWVERSILLRKQNQLPAKRSTGKCCSRCIHQNSKQTLDMCFFCFCSSSSDTPFFTCKTFLAPFSSSEQPRVLESNFLMFLTQLYPPKARNQHLEHHQCG